jgi:cytochrome b6-f complex iron-sulfur subunit
MSRRKFTRNSLFTLLGAFVATSAVATYRMLYPTKVTGFGTKVAAGTVQDIQTQLTNQKFVRNSEGRFYILPGDAGGQIAVYWRCVHLGCTVPAPSPALDGNIQCPCHGSLYNGKTGALIHGPATHPLDYFPMSVEGGSVTVDTGKVISRQDYSPDQLTKIF